MLALGFGLGMLKLSDSDAIPSTLLGGTLAAFAPLRVRHVWLQLLISIIVEIPLIRLS